MGEKVWAGAGYACGLLSLMLILLAFATPNWVESENVTSTQLDKLGLWEICFAGYSDQKDGFGRIYNGCWWIFAREYDGIRQYLLPGWFVAAQGLITVSVVLSILGGMFGLFLLIGCFPSKVIKWVGLAMCLGYYLIALFMAIGLINFGTNAGSSRSWLKQPTLRFLSWSFYCAAIGAMLAIPAGGLFNVYYILVRRMTLHSTAYRAHELRAYTTANSAWRSDMGYRSEVSHPPDMKSSRDTVGRSEMGYRSEISHPHDMKHSRSSEYGRDSVDYRSESSYRHDRVAHKSRRDYESERDYESDRSYDSDRGRRSERSYRHEKGRDRGYDDRGYNDRGHGSQRSRKSDRGHSGDRGHRSEKSSRSERSYR